MCNKLQSVLLNTKLSDKRLKKIYTAIANDTDSLLNKIDTNNNSISELENKVTELKIMADNIDTNMMILSDTLTDINDRFKKIETKLYEDKIEEKAYIFETMHLLAKNKWFWIIIITITMLAGTGIITLLDKSKEIKEVAGSIRGV